MNAKRAVSIRIQTLCAVHNITVNNLAQNAGLSPSTIYSMINDKS